jgi:hypothetical protein
MSADSSLEATLSVGERVRSIASPFVQKWRLTEALRALMADRVRFVERAACLPRSKTRMAQAMLDIRSFPGRACERNRTTRMDRSPYDANDRRTNLNGETDLV